MICFIVKEMKQKCLEVALPIWFLLETNGKLNLWINQIAEKVGRVILEFGT
jgi:hypothetical protein